jgi:hypothetical protein
MPKYILIFIALFVSGCSLKTEITDWQGQSFVVISKRDAIITIDGEKVVVDNRGRPSLIEQLITMMFVNIDKEKITE